MPLIKIHNAKTNEIFEREMNDEELAQYELDKAEAEKSVLAKQMRDAAKSLLLDKLGITEDEAKLLLS